MASRTINISPNVSFTETDLSFRTQNFGITSLGIAGETQKGRAFDPIAIANYDDFQTLFGGLNPCTFKDSQRLKFESAYIAKQFLEESDRLYITRILGLSGYDAGDAWGITFGAALDNSTITEIATKSFTAQITYVNGVINNVTFSDNVLQLLYDTGKITDAQFGDSVQTTGDTISVGNTFYGNCETYTGGRFVMAVTQKSEDLICVTGTTTSGSNTTQTGLTQTCTVQYSAGTITYDSTFIITVNNPIVIINEDTEELITVSQQGTLQLEGGTITHNGDGSVTMVNGTIYLPNGDIITGGTYKICDFESNSAVYDCDTVQGDNFTIVTGTTPTTVNVFVTTTNLITTEFPSGIITYSYSGTMVEMSGTPMSTHDETLVTLLRSKASYDGNENLNFQVEGGGLTIAPVVTGDKINPYDDFKLLGVTTDGNNFEYVVSLDPTKPNYIERVFSSFEQCCEVDVPLYIEENFSSMYKQLVNDGIVDCIKPTLCFHSNLDNYKTEYKGAYTPYIVSELKGNTVLRLFRFRTFSDGNMANTDIKISIQNIKPDTNEFDVIVRRYSDKDKRPVILEAFTKLTLNESSNNYIARRIGTVDGNYVLNSQYIQVEMADTCISNAFPAGFEGYPVRDYSCANNPDVKYKTSYGLFEKKRLTYLGISDTVGIDDDFFTFKGVSNQSGVSEWTGRTSGFHMDKDAASAQVQGVDFTFAFEVGNAAFKNATDISGTDYEKVNARKFTVLPYGGFDGWDIHRTERTNTDLYTVNGSKGIQGLSASNFDTYANNDGETVITSDYYAYLEGIRTFANPDTIDINLFATPSIDTFSHSNLIEETIDMVETERCDSFYVVATPDTDASGVRLTPDDIVNQLDGLYDSSYTATYSYWGQYNDTENNRLVWLPPTAEVMRILALTDKTRAPWYAGAGMDRGTLNYEQLRFNPPLDSRDTLYEGRVNPLTKMINNNQTGLYVFGNKTLQIDDTALNRINIRRLLLYVRKLVANIGFRLLFEQNNENIRRQFESLVNPILRNIQQENGIFDFRVSLSSSPEEIDRGELNGKIGIQPVPSLEFINIDFVVTNTGASFDDI